MLLQNVETQYFLSQKFCSVSHSVNYSWYVGQGSLFSAKIEILIRPISGFRAFYKYDRVATVAETWVLWGSNFQCGSRVLI